MPIAPRRLACLLFALLPVARPACAQRTSPPASFLDSVADARAAWRRGTAAYAAHDLATASREIARASAEWPAHPAYRWGAVAVALAAHDTTAVLAALERYAALGIGRDLNADAARDASLRALLSTARFADVRARLLDATRPLSRGREWARFADSTLFPEGVDRDPRTGRVYLTSVRYGTIVVREAGGAEHDLWPRASAPRGAVLAVRVDTARGVLWATLAGLPLREGSTPADGALAALLRVRLADGVVERRWDLAPIAGGHVLGDVAVAPSGDVLATDSREPVLYRLRAGRDTLERLTSPFFRSLQGIAPSPDPRVIYVADYALGLLRVDLATGDVARLADAANSTSLGCDGIAWDRGAIVAVQNGVAPARVVRFALDRAGRRIVTATVLDRDPAIADEPTNGVIVGREFVYVADSQWEKYDEAGALRPGARLRVPLLRAIALPH